MSGVPIDLTEEERIAIAVLVLHAKGRPPPPPYDHALVVAQRLLDRAADASRAAQAGES